MVWDETELTKVHTMSEETDSEGPALVGRECKHAIYTQSSYTDNRGIRDDLIYVKEVLHYEDGSQERTKRMIPNFKRPFWVTKEGFRDHEEKKEWEKADRLQYYECTQAELPSAVKKALGMFTPNNSMRQISKSPYLYGADITPTAIVKHLYQQKYPDARSPNTVAVLDIETDVLDGTDVPFYTSVTFKDKAVLSVAQEYLDRIGYGGDFEKEMREYFYQRLPEMAHERNIDLEVVVNATPLEMIKTAINRCHEWQPDFISVWNINFDLPILIKTIEDAGADPAEIFSDPDVPPAFRKAYYKEGASKKVTQNGREEPKPWYDRWHTFYTPATFYFIDQAVVFRKLRIAGGKEPSYALDAILAKYTDVRKLKNERADHLSGLAWHQYMQKNEPLEYGAYNLIDCIACEILDEQPKVGDLRQSISVQVGHSDYDKFDSQTRRTVDDFHFFCIEEQGHVIATTPPQMKTKFDEMTVGIDKWINCIR